MGWGRRGQRRHGLHRSGRNHPPLADAALVLSMGQGRWCRSLPHHWHSRPAGPAQPVRHGTGTWVAGAGQGWPVSGDRQRDTSTLSASAALPDHPARGRGTDHAARQRRVCAGPTVQTLTPPPSGANTERGLRAPSCARGCSGNGKHWVLLHACCQQQPMWSLHGAWDNARSALPCQPSQTSQPSSTLSPLPEGRLRQHTAAQHRAPAGAG